ncbi:MAG: nuclear transport factor 2 family protein [Nitriliruptorales bacterium]|nr:nuclear transport factor 2 family protein [Nitriliruptorales bacterium]
MGAAADAFARLTDALTSGELDDIEDIYAVESLYLEPYNPPHRGNLLITAYLKDFFLPKENVKVEVVRSVESADGATLGVEWRISYDAAGRTWSDLARASFLEVDEAGLITYQRDYT